MSLRNKPQTPKKLSTRIVVGDALAELRTLPSQSVQCCITSPPYWGLRDYGTARWEGGDNECIHRLGATGSTKNKGNNNREGTPFRNCCGICGALRIDAQLGLELTADEYVANIVAVFREVRRVLKDDGTLWLNLGDSYAGSTKGSGGPSAKQSTNAGSRYSRLRLSPTVASKNLIGIPWRVAFALQADGWILRSDIIWSKPNPMPESVVDRPTKAHEYVFLLAKSPRYFYDADSIREPFADARKGNPGGGGKYVRELYPDATHAQSGLKKGVWNADGSHTGRNRRSVWTITPQPFKGAHFATFPRALVEPCVLAGSRPGDVVLDPFGGAGTTALVADEHGRRALIIELNPDYAEMARERIGTAVVITRRTRAA